MRGFKRLSRMPLAGGVLAAFALCLSSCGDYTLFDIQVSCSKGNDTSSDENITSFKLTITDEKGAKVLENSPIELPSSPISSNASQFTVGHISYASSRTSGTLTFTVDAYDNSNAKNDIIQTGSAGPFELKNTQLTVLTVPK